MSEHRYIGSTETYQAALNRLRLFEGILDPTTARHLGMKGVAEGWKFLEVGAGAGSVAQWLSSRVGPVGKIVATDIDTRSLTQLNIPNLEIHQHDIVKDNVEAGQYDLVHCPTVLLTLAKPEKALKRMADAVRSGGWLLIEETDYGSMMSTDIIDPSAALLTTVLRAGNDFLRKMKIVDPYFGRQVRGLFEQLGFIDVIHDGWTCMCRGGEPMALFDAATFQMAAKPMIGAGLITQEQRESMQRLLRDLTFNYPGFTMFSALGRKPAQTKI